MKFLRVSVLTLALTAVAAMAQAGSTVYALPADGLACPFCAYGIEKQLSAIEGVASVETDIESGTVTVTMRGGATLEENAARDAVEAAGFTLQGFEVQVTGE